VKKENEECGSGRGHARALTVVQLTEMAVVVTFFVVRGSSDQGAFSSVTGKHSRSEFYTLVKLSWLRSRTLSEIAAESKRKRDEWQ